MADDQRRNVAPESSGAVEPATEPGPHYFAVGCFTVFAGFGGGAMIGVLVAKIAGGVTRCTADPETGAPCSWFMFAVYGAIAGAILLPTLSIWSLKRARRRTQNSERG